MEEIHGEDVTIWELKSLFIFLFIDLCVLPWDSEVCVIFLIGGPMKQGSTPDCAEHCKFTELGTEGNIKYLSFLPSSHFQTVPPSQQRTPMLLHLSHRNWWFGESRVLKMLKIALNHHSTHFLSAPFAINILRITPRLPVVLLKVWLERKCHSY